MIDFVNTYGRNPRTTRLRFNRIKILIRQRENPHINFSEPRIHNQVSFFAAVMKGCQNAIDEN